MGALQASGQALQGIKTHQPLCKHVSSREKCCYQRWCMQILQGGCCSHATCPRWLCVAPHTKAPARQIRMHSH